MTHGCGIVTEFCKKAKKPMYLVQNEVTCSDVVLFICESRIMSLIDLCSLGSQCV